jgi:hypothetical protein
MLRALVLLVAVAACGDNLEPTPDAASPTGLLAELNALPGVTATETPTQQDGYTYIVLRFTQPVDHENPDGPTFQQRVSLLHRDKAATMIVQTSGYWDYYRDSTVELTRLLGSNQISIEHRFFAESRPSSPDWSKLTIKQMADDEHAIIVALRTVYPGAFITTGGSKGGMTAIYHRRFYPDDVDGTVPYVAPISFAAPDTRYNAFFDTVGPPACRQAVRAVATELLQNRRAMVETKATAQAQDPDEPHSYSRIALRPAVESSIISLEWAFWQYYGVSFCSTVPAPTDTDDKLFSFLDVISPVTDNDDAQVAAFDAYYYQAYAQLGYPDTSTPYLTPYIMFNDADYAAALPTAEPAYDGGAAMRDIGDWVKQHGNRLLFVYGQWDPWTAGKFDLGQATDSLDLMQPMGTHGARLTRLADGDRDAAFAKIAAWTGVTPVLPMPTNAARVVEPKLPRVPPAIVRAHRHALSSPHD